jgi:dephospho-CoA kinase
MTSNKLVIGVTGMAGSGKSIVVNIAKEKNYDIIIMGDEVREEAKRRNLEPTPENLGKIMLELRQTAGEAVMAKRCIPKIEKAAKPKAIVDGIRSLAEVEEFKKHFQNFELIAVYASPETRFKRVYRRMRSDDSSDWKVFRERDMRELSVGLGNAISMAEHMIINEGAYEAARAKAKEILGKVEGKWKK